MTPGTPTLDPVTGLSVAPLAITASGTYFSLTEFLYSLETLPRATKVLNVAIAPGTGGEATTTTTDDHRPAADDRLGGAVHERRQRGHRLGARTDQRRRSSGGGGLITCH